MKSKIWIDVDESNGPVLRMSVSEDVSDLRDKMVKRFIEDRGTTSNYLYIKSISDYSFNHLNDLSKEYIINSIQGPVTSFYTKLNEPVLIIFNKSLDEQSIHDKEKHLDHLENWIKKQREQLHPVCEAKGDKKGDCKHKYSRSINQVYPRLCTICGEPEFKDLQSKDLVSVYECKIIIKEYCKMVSGKYHIRINGEDVYAESNEISMQVEGGSTIDKFLSRIEDLEAIENMGFKLCK